MAPNKQQMVQSLIESNQQASQIWKIAQQMAQNPNKHQVLEQLAIQKGVNVEEIIKQARQMGINI